MEKKGRIFALSRYFFPNNRRVISLLKKIHKRIKIKEILEIKMKLVFRNLKEDLLLEDNSETFGNTEILTAEPIYIIVLAISDAAIYNPDSLSEKKCFTTIISIFCIITIIPVTRRIGKV
jgi:hypothetical protein